MCSYLSSGSSSEGGKQLSFQEDDHPGRISKPSSPLQCHGFWITAYYCRVIDSKDSCSWSKRRTEDLDYSTIFALRPSNRSCACYRFDYVSTPSAIQHGIRNSSTQSPTPIKVMRSWIIWAPKPHHYSTSFHRLHFSSTRYCAWICNACHVSRVACSLMIACRIVSYKVLANLPDKDSWWTGQITLIAACSECSSACSFARILSFVLDLLTWEPLSLTSSLAILSACSWVMSWTNVLCAVRFSIVTAKSGVASSVCSRMRKLPRRFSVADMLVSFRVQIANYKGACGFNLVATWSEKSTVARPRCCGGRRYYSVKWAMDNLSTTSGLLWLPMNP